MFSSHLHRLLTAARADDARRAAAAHRRARAMAPHDHERRRAPGRLLPWLAAPRLGRVHAPVHGAVTIRYAFPDDEAGLDRLAALDCAATPSPPLLDLLGARAAQLVAVERAYGPRRSAPPSWRVRVVSEDGPQDVRPA